MFEETIRRRCNCLQEQLRGCSGRPPSARPRRSRGTRTLAEAATRRLLHNLDSLEPASLAGVPPPLIDKLWQAIKRRYTCREAHGSLLDEANHWAEDISTASECGKCSPRPMRLACKASFTSWNTNAADVAAFRMSFKCAMTRTSAG